MIDYLSYQSVKQIPADSPRGPLIRSPGKRLYATRGVRELWVIDPETRIVTIYRFAEGGRDSISEVAESGVLITSLLPGFKIPALLLYER